MLLVVVGIVLAVVVLHAPPAQAAVSTTPEEEDVWRQIQPPVTGQNSGAQSTTSLTLTGGQTYFLFVGTNAAFGQYVNAGDLFTIDKLGVVTPGTNGPDAVLIGMTNTTATYNPFYAVIRVTPTATAPVTLSTNSGGFGSPGSLSSGWTFPPGDSAGHASVLGYHGAWAHSGSPTTEIAFAVKCCPNVQGESAVLSGQTSKSPASSKLAWSRINPPTIFAQLDGAGSGGNVAEIAQGFPAPVGGAYVEITRIGMFGSGNYNCGGTLRISITNTLSVPWNELAEVAGVQVSWTLSGSAPTNNYVTVDWVSAVIGEDAGSVSFGTPTWSIGGNTVTGEGLKALAPFITPAQGEYYVRAYWDNSGCMPNAYVMSRYSGSDSYSGGTAWTVSGGAWVQQPGQDFGGILLSAYGGNKTYEWRLNATAHNTGGATYVYVGEHQRDSNLGLATPSSSWGGTALFGKDLWELSGSGPDCAFNGISNSLCLLREYRLGYMPLPYNTSEALTVTMNMNGMGRNLVYVGTLQNQPVQTHVHKLAWDYQQSASNDLTVYQLWSTNDHFASVNITVRRCTVVAGDGTCADTGTVLQNDPVIPNGSYLGTISNLRTVAGSWDEHGNFSISGQDVRGSQIVLTLTAPGYLTEKDLLITVGDTPASYFANVTMKTVSSVGLNVTQSGVQVTFNLTNPQFSTGQRLEVQQNRSVGVELWTILFQIDEAGNPVRARGFTPFQWTTSMPNQLDVTWPDGRMLNDADTGAYVLSTFIAASESTRGVLVASLPIGVNQAPMSVGTSLGANLNIAGQNDINAQAQANNAAAQRVTEATVQQHFLEWLDWFPRTDLFLPNAILYPVLFMLGALMLRFGRTQWGR